MDRFDAKAEVIEKYGFTLHVDDQPEMLENVPAGVNLKLFRNEGNFDFAARRWMFSGEAGKEVC